MAVEPEPGMLGSEVLEDLGGPVRRSIVGHEELPVLGDARHQGLGEVDDRRLLVVGRSEDRHGGGHPASGPDAVGGSAEWSRGE